MPMDATAYWEQRNQQNAEDRYKLGLERARSGEGQLASMIGSEKAKEEFSLTSLARGGLARGRRPYLVGEKGPELMVPDQDGTIIPNHKLQVLARAIKKRAIARAKGGPVKEGGENDLGGLGTANKNWPGPVKAAAERAAGLAAGEPSLGSPESYGGGRRTVAPQLQEAQLSTGGGGFDPSKPSFSNPVHVIRRLASTWQGPTPGQEYKTLEQANQAFIRAGQGEVLPGTIPGFDPVKGPEIRATGRAEEGVERAKVAARPDLAVLAKAAEAELAAKTSEGHAASLKNWLDTTYGTYDSATRKTSFKPADEGVSRDALAAQEVARREGAPAAKIHFQERQAVRSYLKKVALPENFDVNAYMGAVVQNPAAWQELVAKGRAQKVTQPATPAAPSTMEQLDILGRAATPNWMRPKEWGPAQ